MDTLYIADIPNNYHYAIFNSDYITLFDTQNLSNGTYDCYRIYYNVSPGTYIKTTQSFSQYNTTTAYDIPVSDSWWYRNDLASILTSVLCICVFFIFLFNIFTSAIKRGGILGGLL